MSLPASKSCVWMSAITAATIAAVGCTAETPSGVQMQPATSFGGNTAIPPVAGAGTAPVITSPTAGVSAIPPRAGSGTAVNPSPGAAGTGASTPVAMAGRSAPPVSAAGSGAGVGAAGTGAAGMMMPAAAGSGSAGSMASAGTGSTLMPLPPGDGPTLPAVNGECPEFKNGTTIMVAGHKSIQIAAGEPGKGGPLLFYWHGTGGSAAEAMRTLPAAVRNEIISSGGIIAAFNGSQSSGAKGDCSGTSAHNIADFDAADQIAACAVKNHGVDSRRIYTTGCSAGGLQSGCMAQLRSSYLAASAPNSGGVVFPQQWQDMHSPAIFTMHGGSSDMVIVTFSQTSATLDMNAKAHGSFVVNCNHGGGHCGAPAALQTAAWQFMKDHPWGFGTSPWTMSFPSGVPDYCKVY